LHEWKRKINKCKKICIQEKILKKLTITPQILDSGQNSLKDAKQVASSSSWWSW